MSRLDDALARFGAALDRLEASAEQRVARSRESDGAAAELSLVKAERERLVARIAGLEEESRNLAGLTEDVEDRLDGAISEIREVLGRN
jgi:predicted  nucleic acid-binding Zn-ribbon protein